VFDVLSCPIREEEKTRFWIYLSTQRRVVVRRDVRFEEDRSLGISLVLRDRVEEVPHMQSDAL